MLNRNLGGMGEEEVEIVLSALPSPLTLTPTTDAWTRGVWERRKFIECSHLKVEGRGRREGGGTG